MFGCSDSLNNFLSFCSSKEEQLGYDNMGSYSKEFQAMLDNLDQEDNSEDCGPISGRKRRLRLDQVKGLEKHFEMENKLEPERKIKIAAELELEPRQVTIWFQNRRARWKTKQLEKDYGILKFNYDALKLDYEVLEKENATLASKLRKLREKLSRPGEERNLKSDSKGVGNEAGDGNYSFLLGNNNNNSSVSSSMAISGEFMMKMKEEHQSLFTSEEPCNFCSVDQAPSLHWY